VKALERRLRRLESHLYDPSGFMPHTNQWRDFWFERIRAYASDDYDGPRRPHALFPLEAFRQFMRDAPEDDYR